MGRFCGRKGGHRVGAKADTELGGGVEAAGLQPLLQQSAEQLPVQCLPPSCGGRQRAPGGIEAVRPDAHRGHHPVVDGDACAREVDAGGSVGFRVCVEAAVSRERVRERDAAHARVATVVLDAPGACDELDGRNV